MKNKKLSLEDFELFERIAESMQRTFTVYPNIPLISIKKGGIGFGKNSINYLQLNKNSRILLLKKEGIIYIAVLPFNSKLNGYTVQKTGTNNLHSAFKTAKRGFECGYFKLLPPIFVSELDLYELEPFEINETLITVHDNEN
jgi:hypothetical protein